LRSLSPPSYGGRFTTVASAHVSLRFHFVK
jgi:hypothetical protein